MNFGNSKAPFERWDYQTPRRDLTGFENLSGLVEEGVSVKKGTMYRSKAIVNKLILLLTLRIMSYFTLFPHSVVLTQLVKTGLRFLLTFLAFMMLKQLREKHRGLEFTYQNMTPFLLYCTYLLLGLVSVFWASLPFYALLQFSMVLEALAFAWFFSQLIAYYNALSDNHARFALLFGRAAMFISIGFLLGLAINPDLFYRQTHGGEVSRLGGYIINPNELGMLGVLGGVMGFVELLDERPKFMNWLVITASVTVVLMTQSRSSLGAFLAIAGIYILRTGNMKVIFLSMIGAVLVVPILVQTIILKQGNVEEVMSMTGRLPFWSDLITDGFPKRPLFGWGFMCIAEGDYFHSIHSYSAKMTHNTFVQVLLNLGLVGSFICLLQMVATFNVIFRFENVSIKWLAGMMLIPVLINSFTEFGIFGESNYGIQFYQLLLLFFVIKAVPIISPVYHKQRHENLNTATA
ncbi:MAG: O-antigen ligase family protein [Saprospiraceae bacterium]|nr:O-antigen ligase family protein [Saprospiraceae bacterium]MCF8249879.1 O-antigen ligase family protein [Saprospiraceae bacterium]MCF8279451.1 O-antigen ligase family protein [Bacteroidales bacterium]MCF8311687.1 O-antigen ligase family protein [Saprospiraceae bacterium]MCF8440254.1 O-antigen ligase family protein [Saprospiraceae bacterium]